MGWDGEEANSRVCSFPRFWRAFLYIQETIISSLNTMGFLFTSDIFLPPQRLQKRHTPSNPKRHHLRHSLIQRRHRHCRAHTQRRYTPEQIHLPQQSPEVVACLVSLIQRSPIRSSQTGVHGNDILDDEVDCCSFIDCIACI